MATIIDSSFLEGSYLPQDTLNNIANKVKIEIGDQIIEIDESLNSDSSNPVQNKTIFEKFQELENIIGNGTGTGTNITIDTVLSDTSENPVQNKVINSALENKQDIITGGASTITTNLLPYNTVLISNSVGKVESSEITSTELGYLDGVTSAIQTQINNKASKDVATTLANGLMSSTDKIKLDGIETGANKTTVVSSMTTSTKEPVEGRVIQVAIDTLGMNLMNDISDIQYEVDYMTQSYYDFKTETTNTLDNLNNYSTTPVKIGTWIDGTPIWRVAIPFQYFSTSSYCTYKESNNSVYVNVELMLRDCVENTDDCIFVNANNIIGYTEWPSYTLRTFPGEGSGRIYFSYETPSIYEDLITDENGRFGGWIEFATLESNIVS